ncbi:MAG: glycosyltransferase family 39 protein [Pyrinomonadaceae bacterium]
MGKKQNRKRRDKGNGNQHGLLVYALLLIVAFSFRVAIARFYPNDTPDDGKVYAQIARNVLEHHVFSQETEPPYLPTLIRLPGYPLFLSGVYSLFDHNDNTAVRIVQALIDTATCALIAIVAFFWEPDEGRKRRSSIAALALAAVCPFTTIYVATILTETPTMFFAVAMCLTATLALKATNQKKTLGLWLATGLLAGVAVLFRPDSGLFALAIGITLVVATLGRASEVNLNSKREEILYRTARTSYLGAVFSLAFCLVLVPWTVRNYRVFHLFQPLAPAHAEMPGEFVPRGYLSWLRTWIDDGRYIGPVLWSLDAAQIKLADIPERAFDSAEEKQRVGALLEKYNHPPEEPNIFTDEPDSTNPPALEDQSKQIGKGEPGKGEDSATQTGDQVDEASGAGEGEDGDGGEGDQTDESTPADQAPDQSVEMTPEIDAGFAQIARERVARHPFRYYVWLPLRRAHSLWFDTHSQFYPFEGELLPLDDLDHNIQQQYWLPLFAALTLFCSLLGIAGGWRLWQTGDINARLWLLLAALMIFLRIGYFATLENPEARYVVEVFPFLSILGGIAVVRMATLLAERRAAASGR